MFQTQLGLERLGIPENDLPVKLSSSDRAAVRTDIDTDKCVGGVNESLYAIRRQQRIEQTMLRFGGRLNPICCDALQQRDVQMRHHTGGTRE
jgi:hypothetical protein